MNRLRQAWAGFRFYAEQLTVRLKWHLRRWLTGRRFQTVVIIGMYAPFQEEYKGASEVWGCNFAFRHQTKIDRIFALDAISEWQQKDPHWITEVNETGLPVVMQRHYDEVPTSEPFPLAACRNEVCSRDYYTSSIAYMAAEAIRQGFGSIVFHRVMVRTHSDEFIEQKACLDWWCGVAFGRGIRVVLSDDTQLVRPYPWQSGTYGYVMQDNWANAAKMMGSTMNAIERLPKTFRKVA